MQRECNDIFEGLESWYQRESGQYLFELTRNAVRERLDTTFGYHILQLGFQGGDPLCNESPINHRLLCSSRSAQGTSLVSRADELPLEGDSVDVVIAHHCLEFTPNPHQALREIQRVLTPQGQLIVIGFNPYSLQGLGSRLRNLAGQSPWNEHRPVGERRLTDWLHLLGCEVQAVQRFYSVPPVGGERLRRGLQAIDNWGSSFNSPLGGLYMLHATKQVVGLPRPKRLQRSKSGRMIGLVPKPAPSPTPSAPAPQNLILNRKGRVAA
jgi:SAM-dependent methyltransferase